MAVSSEGMPARSARADSGPSIIVTTKAETSGNSSGLANSSAAMRRMTKMPIVATCDVVRQTRDTSATGWASWIPRSA